MDSIPQKQCSKCKQPFPYTAEYFAIRSKKECTLRGECRNCYSVRQKKWREDNQEYYLDYHKQYRADNAEQVSSIKADWYKRNKARVKPRMLIASKLWKANNRDRVRLQGRAAQSRRNARLRDAEGNYTDQDVLTQLKSQDNKCWWCEKKLAKDYHVDHRIAISRGGTNWPNNICISCRKCNESKHNKMPWEWNGRLL